MTDAMPSHLVAHLVDEMAEAVFFVDPATRRHVYANLGAANLTGYTRAELAEMSPADLRGDLDEISLEAIVTELMATGEPTLAEGEVQTKAGGVVPVEVVFDRPDDAHIVVITARDITGRSAASEREARTREVRALVADRDRIARDLHDTVIQDLFGAGLELHSVATRVDATARERIMRVVDQIDGVIKEIRTTVFALGARRRLGSSTLDAVLAVVDDASRTLGFRPACRTAGPVDTVVGPDLAEELLPVLREMLSNVARHASASTVSVDLDCSDGELILAVADDGCGIDAQTRSVGNGLTNLQTRAERLGGSFSVGSGDGRGSRLVWRVPVGSLSAAPMVTGGC